MLLQVFRLILLFDYGWSFSTLPARWNLSDATLLEEDSHKYVVYDADYDPDLIFVFGGIRHESDFYTYNITNDSLTDYDTLTHGCFTFGRNGAVIVNGVIYYGGNYYAGTCVGGLFSYDLTTKSNTQLLTSPSIYCLAKHPRKDNNKLYFLDVNGGDPNNFYVYDIASGVNREGSALNHTRNGPTCITNNHGGSRYSYFYVLAGDSPYVERINLDTGSVLTDEFEVMSAFSYFVFGSSSDFRMSPAVTVDDLIFLITGYRSVNSGDRNDNDMFYYNISSDSFEYIGPFVQTIYLTSVVLANERIYLFGGKDYSYDEEPSVYSKAIYCSNKIVPFDNSTTTYFPTWNPTEPRVDSMVPTMVTLAPASVSTEAPDEGPGDSEPADAGIDTTSGDGADGVDDQDRGYVDRQVHVGSIVALLMVNVGFVVA